MPFNDVIMSNTSSFRHLLSPLLRRWCTSAASSANSSPAPATASIKPQDSTKYVETYELKQTNNSDQENQSVSDEDAIEVVPTKATGAVPKRPLTSSTADRRSNATLSPSCAKSRNQNQSEVKLRANCNEASPSNRQQNRSSRGSAFEEFTNLADGNTKTSNIAL